MALVALLSNPISTGNRAILPQIRDFCAAHPDIFHYEVEDASQIGAGLASIARVKPKLLIINGGDGTVQAALTELYHTQPFGRDGTPPVAVLPNGKTNLIALDLGADGDPIDTLDRFLQMARGDLSTYVVERELIALTEGDQGGRPVVGMFLGGAGLADIILYCRHKIYPLGLPNFLSHAIAGVAVVISLLFGVKSVHLLPQPEPVIVSLIRDGKVESRLSFLIVTTLEKLLLGSRTQGGANIGLKLMAVDNSIVAVFRAFFASLVGKLGATPIRGVHVGHGDMIRIESDRSSVILDGETFNATRGHPIVLRSTAPVPFLKLAA